VVAKPWPPRARASWTTLSGPRWPARTPTSPSEARRGSPAEGGGGWAEPPAVRPTSTRSPPSPIRGSGRLGRPARARGAGNHRADQGSRECPRRLDVVGGGRGVQLVDTALRAEPAPETYRSPGAGRSYRTRTLPRPDRRTPHLPRHPAQGVSDRGDIPFLHAAATDTRAIRLYESIGFTLRRRTTILQVRTPGSHCGGHFRAVEGGRGRDAHIPRRAPPLPASHRPPARSRRALLLLTVPSPPCPAPV
jgi:hypothetical protein